MSRTFEIVLDEGAKGPMFRRIAGRIRDLVAEGALAPGERLPPIRTLAEHLGVNPATIHAAYRALLDERILRAGVGSGTFVRDEQIAAAPQGPLRFSKTADDLLLGDEDLPDFAGAPPETIDLASLSPDERDFPIEDIRRTLMDVSRSLGGSVFQYGGPRGHAGLREQLATLLRRRGIPCDAEGIVLTQGAQQGLELVARLFVDPGSPVAVECPTYHLALGAFRGLGARLVSLACDEEGLLPEALETALDESPRLLYTMPAFQNPTGRTAGEARRRRWLELAARASLPVLEDDYQADLRYDGREVPALAALAASVPGATVIHVGTLSKGMLPGLRTGWIVTTPELADRIAALRRFSDIESAAFLHEVAGELLRRGIVYRHVAGLKRRLLVRRNAAIAALARHLPSGTTFTRPDGGYLLWATFPASIDARRLFTVARDAGVIVTPGHIFHADRCRTSSVRISLARVDPPEIESGVARLGAAAARLLAETPTGRRAAAPHI